MYFLWRRRNYLINYGKIMKKCILADRHEEMGKDIEKCFICGAIIGKSIEQKIREKTDLVPKTLRQKFLDLMWKGKTLGEAKKICGFDLDIAGQIVMDNIGNYKYLRKDVV